MDSSRPTPKKGPSASDAMFFINIVKHIRNKADIDWEGVALDQGFKSAEVDRVRFGQVKRKLGILVVGDTPASSGRGSAKKADGDASSVQETPTKVTKKSGRVGAKKSGQAQKSSPAAEGEFRAFADEKRADTDEDKRVVKQGIFGAPSEFEDHFDVLRRAKEESDR